MNDDAGEVPEAGWYPDPEFTGELHYWNGSEWTDERQPAPPSSAPPPPGPAATLPPPPFGSPPPPPYTPRRSSQAGTALALSIIGIICCGLTAPFGMVMGRNEMKTIDAGRGDPTARGTAQAAWIIGLIATIIFGLALAFYAIVILAAAGSS